MIIRKIQAGIRRIKYSTEVLLFPRKNYIYPSIQYSHHHISFSQEGEDVIIARIFNRKKIGFYVDVGAHHPQRFSNTYNLYLRGWRGINIDANPESIKAFDVCRPEDINLSVGISSKEESLTYYCFNEPALNGFDEERILSRNSEQYYVTHQIQIQTVPLKSILDKYIQVGQAIDFLNIDVEGLDLEVLHSNDWEKYNPHIIAIEDIRFSLSHPQESRIFQFLTSKNYRLICRTFNTSIFRSHP